MKLLQQLSLIAMLVLLTSGILPRVAEAQLACVFNDECPAPLICKAGRCRAECRSSRDCGIGEICARNARLPGLPNDFRWAAARCILESAYAAVEATPVDEAPQFGLNMPGQDYSLLVMKENRWELCRRACKDETQCRAWTFVNTGVQGPVPYCWLKQGSSPGHYDPNTVSGIVSR